MNMEEFLKTVDEAGGDSKLVMIVFDNSGRMTIAPNQSFDRSKNVKGQFFVSVEKDFRGNDIVCYTHVSRVQGMIFAKNQEDFKYIDRQYLRG